MSEAHSKIEVTTITVFASSHKSLILDMAVSLSIHTRIPSRMLNKADVMAYLCPEDNFLYERFCKVCPFSDENASGWILYIK